MPLSKANQAKYMREYRLRLVAVIPKYVTVIPSCLNPDGTYRDDYNHDLDPYINPLVRSV